MEGFFLLCFRLATGNSVVSGVGGSANVLTLLGNDDGAGVALTTPMKRSASSMSQNNAALSESTNMAGSSGGASSQATSNSSNAQGTTGTGDMAKVVLLGALQGERAKRTKRIEYAALTAAADVLRALR